MHNYVGDSSTFPATIPLIDDSDPPDAAHFDPGPEALADRTAYLKARSLDKTGDSATGHIHIASGAELEVDAGGEIVVDAGGEIVVQAGANEYVDGNLEVRSGGTLNIDVGATGTVRGAISAVSSGAILAAQTAAIRSTVDGGIQCAGSAADYPALSPARTRAVMVSPIITTGGLSTGWVAHFNQVIGPNPGTTSKQSVPFPAVHDGATLDFVTVRFIVSGPHTSVPAQLPRFEIVRTAPTVGTPTGTSDSLSGVVTIPAPGSGSAWDDGNNIQTFDVPCTTNNVIDASQYQYRIDIQDESGANSVGGNVFVGFVLHYKNIVDLRPA